MLLRTNTTLLFEKDELWIHINGGAEVYHEYGFVKAVVQNYTNGMDKNIIIEILKEGVQAFIQKPFKIE
ncbi:hypothetical protein ACFL4T_02900, partial [candidate division KSB1 bacterium]